MGGLDTCRQDERDFGWRCRGHPQSAIGMVLLVIVDGAAESGSAIAIGARLPHLGNLITYADYVHLERVVTKPSKSFVPAARQITRLRIEAHGPVLRRIRKLCIWVGYARLGEVIGIPLAQIVLPVPIIIIIGSL